jgi:hypothetical protein
VAGSRKSTRDRGLRGRLGRRREWMWVRLSSVKKFQPFIKSTFAVVPLSSNSVLEWEVQWWIRPMWGFEWYSSSAH